jgi:tetratricopeptide (TPR) repeat protein
MTMSAWPLLLVLAQGQPLPPGHPPVSGTQPAPGSAPAPAERLPPNHPPLFEQGSSQALPPGHPSVAPGGEPPASGTAPGSQAGLPSGHPAITPGAAAPSTDELLRKMDATPDLKTRPKPYEVSAAIGKLYYGRGRWTDARDHFVQAEKTADPVRTLFLEQRKQAKGALPDPAAEGCRVSGDVGVSKAAERARALAAEKKHAPAAACALEALGPVLESTTLLGNALALLGDTAGALAAYERVLKVAPGSSGALYGHGAVTFDVRGDDLAALRTARKELQSAADVAPGAPHAASARALAQRIDQVIAAGGATKFARTQEKARAEARPGIAAAPEPAGTMAAAPGPQAPSPPAAPGPSVAPTLSKETMEAFQKIEVTPEMQANFARLIEEGEAKLVSNHYAEALESFKQVMPYQPGNPRLRAGMAWALIGLQRPMADNVWRVAVSSDPASVDALGDRLAKAGNKESARALWSKLQDSAPDYASRSGVPKKLGRAP